MKSILVTHHEIILKILPTGRKNPITPLSNISILDIFNGFKKWGYESKRRMFKNNDFCGLIPIINISHDKIDLLLCISDKHADNQIVRDFDNINNTRVLTRRDSEGVDSVAHIVIKLDNKNTKNLKFAMERKAGLTPKLFIDTLNYFLKDATKNHVSDFMANHPVETDKDGNPKKVKLNLKFDYESVLSDEVIKAFEKGKIDDVFFHQPISSSQSFDPSGNYQKDKTTVHLGVKGKIIKSSSKTIIQKAQDIKNSFKGLIKANSLQKTTFTIKFRNESGQNQTAYYDPSHDEIALAKKTYIDKSLKQPVSKDLYINQKLCDKMYYFI